MLTKFCFLSTNNPENNSENNWSLFVTGIINIIGTIDPAIILDQ